MARRSRGRPPFALAIIFAATAFGLAVAGLFDRATVVIPVSGS